MIFWILTTPRSGSNFVTAESWRRIGGKPKFMEYFNPRLMAANSSFKFRSEAPVTSYLDFLLEEKSHRGVLCVKMLWIQMEACLRYGDFVPALTCRKAVLLQRRDVVKQGISLYIAKLTGQWSSFNKPKEKATPEISYSFQGVTRCIEWTELHNALLKRFLLVHEVEHTTVFHEDFLADADVASGRVLDFLGLPPTQAPGSEGEFVKSQTTQLNLEFYRRFLEDDRKRFQGGECKGFGQHEPPTTIYRDNPLFSGATNLVPEKAVD